MIVLGTRIGIIWEIFEILNWDRFSSFWYLDKVRFVEAKR